MLALWFAVGVLAAPSAGGGINGASAVTLAAVTPSATATVRIAGTTTATLANASGTATSTLRIASASALTLQDATSTALGALRIVGSSASTLGAVTLSSFSGGAAFGALSVQLEAASATATAQLVTPSKFAKATPDTTTIYARRT